MVGCLFTALLGLFYLLVKSVLFCALVHLAVWLVPALSERIDTQGFSDPVILALRPAFDMQHLTSPVVPPVRPALAPTVAPFILPVRLAPAPAFTPVLLPGKLVPWLAVDQVFHQIVLLQ